MAFREAFTDHAVGSSLPRFTFKLPPDGFKTGAIVATWGIGQ
jgi:hypothetical protein